MHAARFIPRATMALLLAAFGGSAAAATITVDSAADESLALADTGNCTLREAVESANDDTAIDACAAGSGADTIEFAAGLAGETITLVSGLFEDNNIAQDIDVDGAPGPSRLGQRGAGLGFHRDDLAPALQPCQCPGDQPAAAHRDQDRVGGEALRLPFAHQRALSGHRGHRVIGMDLPAPVSASWACARASASE